MNDLVKDRNLMLLRRQGGGEGNLFLVHDRSGDVVGYIEFCRQLLISVNCWGIQGGVLAGFAPREVSIEGIAGEYVEKMKRVQPLGPYLLGGWSFGGEVTFEMVRQLEALGEEIGFLAFIDAPGPQDGGQKDISGFSLETELALIKKYFPGMGLEARVLGLEGLEQFWPVIISELETRGFHPGYLRRIVADLDRNAVPFSAGLDIRRLVHYWNMNRSFLRARRRYIPGGKIKTRLYYYGAAESRRIEKGNWDDYCEQEVVYRELPGNHHSIFRLPLVQELARVFSLDLNRQPQI